MRKISSCIALTAAFVMLLCSLSIAQPFGPPKLPDKPQDTLPPADIPIDGGLGILLAAGAGYGIKKFRERKKLQSPDNN